MVPLLCTAAVCCYYFALSTVRSINRDSIIDTAVTCKVQLPRNDQKIKSEHIRERVAVARFAMWLISDSGFHRCIIPVGKPYNKRARKLLRRFPQVTFVCCPLYRTSVKKATKRRKNKSKKRRNKNGNAFCTYMRRNGRPCSGESNKKYPG